MKITQFDTQEWKKHIDSGIFLFKRVYTYTHAYISSM